MSKDEKLKFKAFGRGQLPFIKPVFALTNG